MVMSNQDLQEKVSASFSACSGANGAELAIAATPARTQSPGSPVPSRVQGARPVTQPGLDKAQRALAAPSQALRVPLAPPRSRFTIAEIEMLQFYGRTRILRPVLGRDHFEKFHPEETARLSRALDVADIVLQAAGDFVEKLQREVRRKAAQRRIRRREGGRR